MLTLSLLSIFHSLFPPDHIFPVESRLVRRLKTPHTPHNNMVYAPGKIVFVKPKSYLVWGRWVLLLIREQYHCSIWTTSLRRGFVRAQQCHMQDEKINNPAGQTHRLLVCWFPNTQLTCFRVEQPMEPKQTKKNNLQS